jgi:hypothetical protein
MEYRKKVIVSIIVITIILIVFSLVSKLNPTGKIVNKENITITRLDTAQREKINEVLLSNEFISDLPEKGIFSLWFYDFVNGERIWQDRYLIGKNKILEKGEPDFSIIIHSKYIEELNNENLCEIIQKAKTNGDFGFESEKNKASLLLKYSGMLEYRNCFGF